MDVIPDIYESFKDIFKNNNGKVSCYFGCGHIDWHDKGFLNVDIRPDKHIDIVCDLSKDIPIKDDYVDKIVAHSLLEHFPMGDYKHDDLPYANTVRILMEWCRILKPGGELEIKVPNVRGLTNCYLNKGMDIIEFFRYLYGGQNYPENTHLAGFDRKTMDICLRLSNFSSWEFIHSHNDNGKFEELDDWEMRVKVWK